MENILVILFLVFLEGILSFDNALALAAMVKPLPIEQQRKALTYGMAGAFIFRFISLFFIVHLLENPWVRACGGLYLVWLAYSNLAGNKGEGENKKTLPHQFWRIIILVELTDVVFSIDSILAAAALSQQLWVIVVGGIFGIIMMRFVSVLFIQLIDTFPRLEKSAFILVAIVGTKLLLESQTWYLFDFHSKSALEFYLFWASMLSALAYGFTSSKETLPA